MIPIFLSGTDATHADHIETIKSRLYVGLEDGIHFLPCHLGMGLVEGYDDMGFLLSKPNLRAELEADLKRWVSIESSVIQAAVFTIENHLKQSVSDTKLQEFILCYYSFAQQWHFCHCQAIFSSSLIVHCGQTREVCVFNFMPSFNYCFVFFIFVYQYMWWSKKSRWSSQSPNWKVQGSF